MGIWNDAAYDLGRLGTYGEVTYRATSRLSLRMRGGTIDPDMSVVDSQDLFGINVGCIWKYDILELQALYLIDQTLSQPFATGEPENTHELFVKVLFTM
jgi:hypothetical protein